MAVQSKTISFAFILVFAVAGVAAALLWRHPSQPVDLTTGTLLSPARELPDFSLIDQGGRRFTPVDLQGHWSLMFFGYTNCPDFCPTTLATLAALEKRLRQDKATLPRVIFMSVDAKRDTPAQLAKYVPYFDPDFLGVTAPDQPSIEALAAKLGVAVSLHPAVDGNYTVDHSGAIFVIDPSGKLTAILTGPFTVEALSTDFQRLVAARA